MAFIDIIKVQKKAQEKCMNVCCTRKQNTLEDVQYCTNKANNFYSNSPTFRKAFAIKIYNSIVITENCFAAQTQTQTRYKSTEHKFKEILCKAYLVFSKNR